MTRANKPANKTPLPFLRELLSEIAIGALYVYLAVLKIKYLSVGTIIITILQIL